MFVVHFSLFTFHMGVKFTDNKDLCTDEMAHKESFDCRFDRAHTITENLYSR